MSSMKRFQHFTAIVLRTIFRSSIHEAVSTSHWFLFVCALNIRSVYIKKLQNVSWTLTLFSFVLMSVEKRRFNFQRISPCPLRESIYVYNVQNVRRAKYFDKRKYLLISFVIYDVRTFNGNRLNRCELPSLY